MIQLSILWQQWAPREGWLHFPCNLVSPLCESTINERDQSFFMLGGIVVTVEPGINGMWK